jgi:hypothetical protein
VGESWELYTESKALDVIVPPVDLAWSQWMENWSGSICRRRCDGQTDVKNDERCQCDPDAPDCKPTSRLSVLLTVVEGIGTFRLETHGWAAAAELNGAIEVLRAVQSRNGSMVPARLLLEQRQKKTVDKDGKPQTFNFSVPSLDLRLSVAALTGGTVTTTPQLTSGVTPIQSEPTVAPSLREQLSAVEAPVARPARSNAAAPMPSTGIAPRPSSAVPAVPDTPAQSGGPLLTEAQGKMIGRLFGKLNITDRDERLSYLTDKFQHEFTSSKELTKREASALISELMGLAGEEEKPRTSSTNEEPPPREPQAYDFEDEAPF